MTGRVSNLGLQEYGSKQDLLCGYVRVLSMDRRVL